MKVNYKQLKAILVLRVKKLDPIFIASKLDKFPLFDNFSLFNFYNLDNF